MPQPQLPAGLKNPFLNYKMDVTAGLPPGDVPELHADLLSRCGEMLDHAKDGGEGVGFLVVGEAGSGKSHLVAQLLDQYENLPRVVLACVRMKGAFAGRLWRHIRDQLVRELLTEYRQPKHGATPLRTRRRPADWLARRRRRDPAAGSCRGRTPASGCC